MGNAAVHMLGIETVGVALMVLSLFWMRRWIGLTPLYVTLGVFQPVQVILSASVYVDIVPGLPVSPGQLLFAASLLAVLLVYIREDAVEARKVIYGILGANLAMTLVMYVASLQLRAPGTSNFLAIAPELFSQGARVTAVGTTVFLVDVVLLILIYGGLRERLRRSPFLRVLVTLGGVLLFDAFAFTLGAFHDRADLLALLQAALASKALVALFFSLVLVGYLRFIEPSGFEGGTPDAPLRDFFYAFTYREKLELQARRTDEAEARLAKAQAVAKMGFLDWHLATDVIYWSDEMLRIFGMPPGRNRQTLASTLERVHPDDLGFAEASVRAAVDDIAPHSIDHRMLRMDGSVLWVHAEGELIRDADGNPERFLGTLVDITEAKREEEERRQVFERITDAFVALDRNWVYTYVNPKAAQIFGRTPEQLVGRHIWTEFPEGRDQPFARAYERAMAEQVPMLLEEYYAPYDRWFENRIYPSPEGLTIYFHDITERVRQQQALQWRASHDELTGLPNRHAMREALEAMLASPNAGPAPVGAVVLNIDRLHHVNDTLGYPAGDQVLVEAGRRLGEFGAGRDCLVGRIGGDEFLLATQAHAPRDLPALAREAMDLLAQPFVIDGEYLHLSCSAGAASADPQARPADAAQLIGQADLALNSAKERGRNQLEVHSRERSLDLAARVALNTEMRQALPREEFTLHYQPVVDATSGRIVAAEALMRWRNANLGVVPPGRFIPVAEDTGMIVRLGDWALRRAVADIARWQAAGHAAVPVSVNVSAVQFQRPEFVDEVAGVLRDAGVEARLLKLEMTEGVVLQDVPTAIAMLGRLRLLGVRVALDDFGTGYSNLSQLRHLPIDEIKIDQSFVRGIVEDRYPATLCHAVISMGRQLAFGVVAEGVETPEQAALLARLGCPLLQGFLFSRAVEADAFADLLASGAHWQLDGRRAGVGVA